MLSVRIVFATVLALLSAPVTAQPKLLSSSPAAGSSIPATSRVDIRFDEVLDPADFRATIVMTGMNGHPHAPMEMPGVTSALSGDRRSLVVSVAKPLIAGTYRVDWHVAGADARRTTGSIDFTVR